MSERPPTRVIIDGVLILAAVREIGDKGLDTTVRKPKQFPGCACIFAPRLLERP